MISHLGWNLNIPPVMSLDWTKAQQIQMLYQCPAIEDSGVIHQAYPHQVNGKNLSFSAQIGVLVQHGYQRSLRTQQPPSCPKLAKRSPGAEASHQPDDPLVRTKDLSIPDL
jgi:hypothetical protein